MRLFRAHVLIAAGLFGAMVLLAFTGDARSDAAADIAATPSRGTLVARPGMTVAEIARRSSLALNVGRTVIADARSSPSRSPIPRSASRAAATTS